MTKYSVYFLMTEMHWHRFDTEAESPQDAMDKVGERIQMSDYEPDEDIYDCLNGPYMSEVTEFGGEEVLLREEVDSERM